MRPMNDSPSRIPRHAPSPFRPPSWLRNPHAQTLASEYTRRNLAARFPAWSGAARELSLTLPDDDCLRAYLHLHPDDPERRRPVVIHLHGLEGSADSHYQQGLSAKAFAAGFHTLRLSFRNCGDTEHMARQLYHGAMTGDVQAVIDLMRDAWGLERFLLTGVSFGGNLLLKYLSECGDAVPSGLLGAAAISAAIDLNEVTFADGLSWGYERYFLRLLKRKMRRKVRFSPGGEELRERVAQLGGARTLRDFDALITAPLNGFGTPANYYALASSADHLDRIQVPTLLIHAEDDPVVPFAMYRSRMERIRSNPMLVPLFPEAGGHVGFYSRGDQPLAQPWMDERWCENEAIAFLAALVSAT
ncbi:putative hydrolase [compost metagenome]